MDNMGISFSQNSRDVSALETEELAIKPFRFLDLPPELRLAIYAQILVTDKPLHWIGWIGPDLTSEKTIGSFFAGFLSNLLGASREYKTGPIRRCVSSYVSTTTALLFTCETIYREAIELFYRNNTFVIRAMTTGFQPSLRHRPLLSFVRRLCIQYKGTYEPSALEANDFRDLVDASISSCLQGIIDTWPDLNSLTICGIPDMAWVYYRHRTSLFTAEDDDSFH